MKIMYLVISLLVFIQSSVYAQPIGNLAPDIVAGKKRAAVCFSCHNQNGISKIPGIPHLAGQERTYLEKALRAYKEGQQRQDPTMTAMAKPLSESDIVNIAAYFSLQTRMNNGQTAAQTLEALERIRPVGTTSVEIPAANPAEPIKPQSIRSGEAVYQASCVACHGSGVAGAPKIGDKAAWSSRVAQGNSVLIQHALQGFKGMPAKGTCSSCSDAEIKGAVEFLIQKSK